MLRTLAYLPLLLLLSACTQYNSPNDSGLSKVIDNWQYYEGVPTQDSTKWIKLNSLNEISKTGNENILLLKAKLPVWNGTSPALYIGQIDHFIRVFLNDKLIYQLGDPESRKLIGLNQNIVELPFFEEDDELKIKVSTEQESLNILDNIVLSSSGNIITTVFNNSFGSLFFSSLFFFIGLSVLVIYIAVFKSKLLLGIAAFIISNSFLFASNSLILQLLVKAPALYYRIDYISLMCMTTSGFFAIEQIIFSRYRPVIKVLWQSHFVFLVVHLTLLNFTSITFPDVLPYFMIFLAVSMVVCFIAMVLSTKSGDFESKLLFIGMSGFFFFAVLEIILYFREGLFVDYGFNVRVLHYGALCFVSSLMWIVVRDYLNTSRQKESARQNELEAIKRENKTRQEYSARLLESQEKERKRIAAELHDAVGQDLLIIKNTALLALGNKKGKDQVDKYLNQISDTTSKSIEDIRYISRNLHPFQIEKLGLTKALNSIVNFVKDKSSVKYKSNIGDLGNAFSKEEAIHIYRILQEIINNIIKHSGATEVFIDAGFAENNFQLTVQDNGKGLPVDKSGNIPKKYFGFGLTGMMERAKILNRSIEIKPGSNCGLSIKLIINKMPEE